MMRGSWSVEYHDGRSLSQYTHGIEVPMGQIEWAQVRTIRFDSQDATSTFDVPPAPDGLAWSLRRRTWMRPDGHGAAALLLVLSVAGVDVDHDSTTYVLYWFTDGTVHESSFFTSRETDEYGSGMAHGLPKALVSNTSVLRLNVDAISV